MSSFALAYERFGEPGEVLQKVPIQPERTLKNSQVLVKYIASPINPADINTIQGVYPLKPASFPAIGGNEGVAEVLRIGPNVKSIQVGDKVIPAPAATGTWTTHRVLTEKDFIVLDKNVDPLFAAQITVNPGTAYRMLQDFVKLQEGDSVIQNGGNSAVGVYAIQLAKLWNIKTINVIRDRPDVDELRQYLKSLGADYVLTEEEIRKKEVMDEILSKVGKPKLALNCVGGQCATDCVRHLADGGTMVTYGGMSKKPVVLPTGSFIFKDHRFVGFWMTRWSKANQTSPKRIKMLSELSQLNSEKKLIIPKTIQVKLDDYKEVFETIQKGFSNSKYVFTFE
ncbi:PREDICTED: probable trans-2-enoyl-CoA reductase, mitochondrial [Rhagoletis zephyria]|uniref:probable trans-2-enoyl-CoA reductase, mitochondrial n=1 Tax=Rhagoletis zephyria TaxID=28612 RepID=UPI0008118CAE|nr:PREDICTED: probable trans-2-enoyl-CoA reductase, mitochondrial [Rhagoletis zephyria]